MTAGRNRGNAPLALYVHWPYCLSKCPYCDFNSHVAGTIDQTAWREAYSRELDSIAGPLAGRRLISIFFGGGTPSLMDPATAGAVIERATALWPPLDAAGPEITLEANPTSAEAARFAAFKDAGVNRLSLGLQALDDAALAFLGRTHSADEGLVALDLARRHFERVNADMIYARPGQTVAAWGAELDRLLAKGLAHLSLYQLTIERGTPFFAAHRRGDFALPGDDAQACLLAFTDERLAAQGLYPYEVSNYARPGQECRHNLNYWRYGDFAGIGPGAHGRLTLKGGAVATENLRAPRAWLESVQATGRGLKAETPLTFAERIAEMVMMGLRLADGIAADDFEAVAGAPPARILGEARVARLVTGGYLRAGEGLAATAAGRLRLDAVIAELLKAPVAA